VSLVLVGRRAIRAFDAALTTGGTSVDSRISGAVPAAPQRSCPGNMTAMEQSKKANRWQVMGISLILLDLIFFQMLQAGATVLNVALLASGAGLVLLTFNGRRFALRNYLPLPLIRAVSLFSLALFVDLMLGQLVWPSNQTSSVLLLPAVAALLLALSPPKVLNRLLLACVLVALVLASYEYITKTYLYTISVAVQGEIVELDERLMGGGANIFRAKAMFAGPLTLSIFTVFAAVLLRDSTKAVAACFLTALVSTSRTGIFLTGAILLMSVLSDRGMRRMTARLILAAGVLGVGTYALLQDTSGVGRRVLGVLDFSDQGANALRAHFWRAAVDLLNQYSLSELLLGNNGEFAARMGSSTESGWLYIAVNHGLATLGAHVVMLGWLMRRMTWQGRGITLAMAVGNSVVAMSFGLVGCLLFWMALLSMAREGIELRRVAAASARRQMRRHPEEPYVYSV
jgi:hypothetical protein